MKQLLIAILFPLIVGCAGNEQTIVSQSPYVTHTLQYLGLEGKIVGVSKHDRLDRPRTGTIFRPDKQAITELKPKYFITSNWTHKHVIDEVVPEGTIPVVLDGFRSMGEIEGNLVRICDALGVAGGQEQAERFHHEWTQKAALINGNSSRVLLLSACTGQPYSFGKKTWLYDLFQHAGFEIVETHEHVRHITIGNEFNEVKDLVNHFKPDFLIVFERDMGKVCSAVSMETNVKVINLDGDYFLHPAPVILKGLTELKAKEPMWLD
ncbi:ABC transporter substrate-binding protein [Chlorobium phaeovibrioides]|uniref:ABC transporter substrate-binding protein n=1 Tax=Chlorobium phaeovibrioides TaxID=1094 RepID=UPI000F841EA7|nr:ABC transporter substrate-binding protein [Chlorobium phaeovibrioides]RTY35038.1 ABC transporter substrate-binding protein [Chlorobium phaeovibrioides]